MIVCRGGSVGVLMRFVWRSLCVGIGVLVCVCVGGGVCGWGCVWGGWGVCVCLGVLVGGWVSGWVSEFWTSGIVYMLIRTISVNAVCLTQFEENKTLFNLQIT